MGAEHEVRHDDVSRYADPDGIIRQVIPGYRFVVPYPPDGAGPFLSDPTEEEIAARVQEIQARWSRQLRSQRRVSRMSKKPVEACEFSYREGFDSLGRGCWQRRAHNGAMEC